LCYNIRMNRIRFLDLEPEAFGLDFSDRKLRLARLDKVRGSLTLTSYSEVVLPGGIIASGDVLDEGKLTKAVLELVSKAKLKTKYVVASLPERKGFLRVIDVLKMTESELKTAIPFEVENYIPLTSDNIYMDYRIIGNSRESNKMEVLIGAMPKAVVDPYINCLTGAGLIPKALEIESQAIVRSVIAGGVSPFPCLIIDFGRTTTSLTIYSGNSLRFTASLLISSGILTETIAKERKINVEEAEKLKIDQGMEAIKQSSTDIVSVLAKDIKKYIQYYRTHSGNSSGEIKRILLCGAGANLKGLDKFILAETKIKTELANPWANIIGDKKTVPKIPRDQSLGYTTALGLALRGINATR